MKKRIILLALSVFMIFSLAGCGHAEEEKEIKKVIHRFQEACNDKDVERLLDLIDPAIGQTIKMFLKMTKVDVNGKIEEISGAVIDGIDEWGIDSSTLMENLMISVDDISCDKSSASVDCSISVDIAGADIDTHGIISLKKENEKWYISFLELYDDE